VESPTRHFTIGKEVWIEREDFEEVPPKGYKRLFPGNVVRLKGGYVIECTGCARDANGQLRNLPHGELQKVVDTLSGRTLSGSGGSDRARGCDAQAAV